MWEKDHHQKRLQLMFKNLILITKYCRSSVEKLHTVNSNNKNSEIEFIIKYIQNIKVIISDIIKDLKIEMTINVHVKEDLEQLHLELTTLDSLIETYNHVHPQHMSSLVHEHVDLIQKISRLRYELKKNESKMQKDIAI
jgi:hypothetical protein